MLERGHLLSLLTGALLRIELIDPNVVKHRCFDSRALTTGALIVIMFNIKFRRESRLHLSFF